MGASFSSIATADDQIQAVDNLQHRLDGLKHVLHDLQEAVDMLKHNDEATPISYDDVDRHSSSNTLRRRRSHIQSPLCEIIPSVRHAQQVSTGPSGGLEKKKVTPTSSLLLLPPNVASRASPKRKESPKLDPKSPSLTPPPPPPRPPPPPPSLPRRGRGPSIPPPPPPSGHAPPSPGGSVPSSTESSSSMADVERKLDALYKIMTRTLSLVQSGGGGSSAAVEHGLPEWTGPKTRPPADEDPEGAEVYDAREEMLRELRERVAIRRKTLDENPQQD